MAKCCGNEWIDWAECCWGDIRETNTLNVKEARSEEDTKHICPLQLDVIDRLVRLYSNPGEVVFSPFTGIGSEGVCLAPAWATVLRLRTEARVTTLRLSRIWRVLSESMKPTGCSSTRRRWHDH
jgi:hypothetical protein